MIDVQSDSAVAAFDERSSRAVELARVHTSAAPALRFAADLLRTQGAVAASLELLHSEAPLTGHFGVDAQRVMEHLLDVARFCAQHAPAMLAAAARLRVNEDARLAHTRLDVFWHGRRPAREDYLSRAMLRPWVETLRALAVQPDRAHPAGHCPFCGGAASVGCRRGGTGAEGAARSLVCAQCGLEWIFPRIRCPACNEQDPHKLPVFTSEAHGNVRIEACETCRRYVKSIDLSLDARPMPEVDDLASIALDLWAVEQGFTRIEPGLAGV